MAQRRQIWGKSPEGDIELIQLETRDIKLWLTNQGAALVDLQTPDLNGTWASLVIHEDTAEAYRKNPSHLGATVGRFGNRIKKGRFELDGETYSLAVNNGPNHLHGGDVGFTNRLWSIVEVTDNSVTFEYISPDGEEGYPGTLHVRSTYRLENHELIMEYHATTDTPTVLNLTNHAYWNLTGDPANKITSHELTLNADRYLENDSDVLPTGRVFDVDGTVYDFRKRKLIGESLAETDHDGYDNCLVLNQDKPSELTWAASVREPSTGRGMSIHTTQPAIQLYTANHFDGSDVCAGAQQHSAFCLECQNYPDAPNQPEFPSSVLSPEDVYEHTTKHTFVCES